MRESIEGRDCHGSISGSNASVRGAAVSVRSATASMSGATASVRGATARATPPAKSCLMKSRLVDIRVFYPCYLCFLTHAG